LQIKAHREGFILAPDAGASFSAIRSCLEHRLDDAGDFFQGSDMVLDLGRRPFAADEIVQLRELLEGKAQVRLVEVWLGPELDGLLSWASRGLGIPLRRTAVAEKEDEAPRPVVVRHTCRSGTRIESPADCFIQGDVNPGAEVIAAGDIWIFGVLRGVAHAGAGGDRSACVRALSIQPNQIRIADLVAVPPKGEPSSARRFEMAEVREGRIQVITL